MSSPNGERPIILYDLIKVADFGFLSYPLKMGRYKKVSFNDIIEYNDIISRSEIEELKLKENIWWEYNDYQRFQVEASMDILKFIADFPGLNYYQASRLIWSPNFIELIK